MSQMHSESTTKLLSGASYRLLAESAAPEACVRTSQQVVRTARNIMKGVIEQRVMCKPHRQTERTPATCVFALITGVALQ